MKYYTKEWYKKLQKAGIGNCFRMIPDGEYTDSRIRALYREGLEETMREEQQEHDQEPERLTADMFRNLSSGIFMNIDEKTGTASGIRSKDELSELLESDYQRQLALFESRPPFDRKEVVYRYRASYTAELRNAKNWYPAWMLEAVDVRLIALGLLPESAYNRYMKELGELQQELKNTDEAREKALADEKIPKETARALQLHDASLLSLKQKGNDLIMEVNRDGLWPMDPTPYRRVIFRDCQIIEKDPGLRPRKRQGYDGLESGIQFLYSELYRTKSGGFEVHIMFWSMKDLYYLTLSCSNMEYEDGVEI